MKRLLAAAALAIVAMATTAHAEPAYMTGNKYMNNCPTVEFPKQPQTNNKTAGGAYVDKVLNWTQCLGYVLGYFDAVAAWQNIDADTAPVCTDSGVTAQQMHEVLLSYLKNHPQSRNEPMVQLALMAFADAWPCSKKTPQAAKRGA